MEEGQYEIDPDGDAVIFLEHPTVPFAVWEDGGDVAILAAPGGSVSLDEAGDDEMFSTESDEKQTETQPRSSSYRVSSRHLILASAYFKGALSDRGPFASRERTTEGRYVLKEQGWDHEAFLILLNILHLRNKQVPKPIDLEMLTKIAVLVDCYRCEEAIGIFVERWIETIRAVCPPPKTYNRELIFWIFVSWIFKLPGEFTQSTAVAIKNCTTAEINDLGIAIPQVITCALAKRRSQAIESIMCELHRELERLSEPGYVCKTSRRNSFECSAILLGALTLEMKRLGYLSPRPKSPFAGWCLEDVVQQVSKIRSPIWYDTENGHYRSYLIEHDCNFKESIMKRSGGILEDTKGLVLQDYTDSTQDTGIN
ncbi:hypothetical protein BS50DRAFT_558477 [Corynespora cassiicola Philippines]|uniref:BTB domain-containing protein n=1 Tax=Corynespora cassiicola Philippines TaxID=1448308 RepID=A0A2T2NF96_CORCC|nr:hypothetical protein BS50DRAFT_558477 [Corynespora cassiicola Philippines]